MSRHHQPQRQPTKHAQPARRKPTRQLTAHGRPLSMAPDEAAFGLDHNYQSSPEQNKANPPWNAHAHAHAQTGSYGSPVSPPEWTPAAGTGMGMGRGTGAAGWFDVTNSPIRLTGGAEKAREREYERWNKNQGQGVPQIRLPGDADHPAYRQGGAGDAGDGGAARIASPQPFSSVIGQGQGQNQTHWQGQNQHQAQGPAQPQPQPQRPKNQRKSTQSRYYRAHLHPGTQPYPWQVQWEYPESPREGQAPPLPAPPHPAVVRAIRIKQSQSNLQGSARYTRHSSAPAATVEDDEARAVSWLENPVDVGGGWAPGVGGVGAGGGGGGKGVAAGTGVRPAKGVPRRFLGMGMGLGSTPSAVPDTPVSGEKVTGQPAANGDAKAAGMTSDQAQQPSTPGGVVKIEDGATAAPPAPTAAAPAP